MSTVKLASALTAFLVQYEVEMCNEYLSLNCCSKELFKRQLIGGPVLAIGKEEVVKKRPADIAGRGRRKARIPGSTPRIIHGPHHRRRWAEELMKPREVFGSRYITADVAPRMVHLDEGVKRAIKIDR